MGSGEPASNNKVEPSRLRNTSSVCDQSYAATSSWADASGMESGAAVSNLTMWTQVHNNGLHDISLLCCSEFSGMFSRASIGCIESSRQAVSNVTGVQSVVRSDSSQTALRSISTALAVCTLTW